MQRLYVWADGAPVAQKVSTTLTYLHTDHLDTPRWGTSSAGTLVWRWKSDGFGEAVPEQDPDANGVQVSVNLRFPGQYYDVESGLHQNWMRDYTPGYGRYAQSDPIGQQGGINVYLYTGNDPANAIDLFGLSERDVGRIEQSYRETLERMNQNGNRVGSGYETNGRRNINYWNCLLFGRCHEFFDYKNQPMVCQEQASEVRNDWRNLQGLDDMWTFEVVIEERPFWFDHAYPRATSSNPDDPIIERDPWREPYPVP
jgi:RHS repeat-associated protein